MNACKSFTQEPQNRLIRTKIYDLFKKLDVKFWLYDIDNKQDYSKSVIIITQSEKNKLEKYKRVLNKLYNKVEDYKQKIENQLQWIVYDKNANILVNKKKIEKLGNIFNILKVISATISQPTDSIDYRWMSDAWKLWDINGYLSRYREVIEKKKSWIAVLYNCEINPEMCSWTKGELEEVTEDEVKNDKFEFEDKDIIKMYYAELDRVTYERAYNMKYKPEYSLTQFKNLYRDVKRVYLWEKTIIHIKDFYKYKVLLTLSDWGQELYLVNVKIIDGKIKTLSSKKIK